MKTRKSSFLADHSSLILTDENCPGYAAVMFPILSLGFSQLTRKTHFERFGTITDWKETKKSLFFAWEVRERDTFKV